MIRLLARLRQLLDLARGLSQSDDRAAYELAEISRRRIDKLQAAAPRRSDDILALVPEEDIEAVVQRLNRLRIICDADMLDYAQLLDFARDLYECGWSSSWPECLDQAIEAAELTGREQTRAGETGQDRARIEDRDRDPIRAIDAPNPRLPLYSQR